MDIIPFHETKSSSKFVVNTTSRSNNWSQGLSPFYVGPIKCYNNFWAKNLENVWQFAKVYPEHVDSEGNIKDEYFRWRDEGVKQFLKKLQKISKNI